MEVKKMDIRDIANKYKYKTELHLHTFPVSACSEIRADEAVRIYAEAGVHSIVVTNHLGKWVRTEYSAQEYLDDYYKAKQAGEKYGVNVILGAELRFDNSPNDYLIYGIDENDIKTLADYTASDIATFYREIKNDRNVIIQAHPFRNGMERVPSEFLDGIEVFNLHPNHNSRVGIAARYAKDEKLIVTCGSDFHHPHQEALALVRSKKPLKDSFEVAELIKSQDLLFDFSGNIVFPY